MDANLNWTGMREEIEVSSKLLSCTFNPLVNKSMLCFRAIPKPVSLTFISKFEEASLSSSMLTAPSVLAATALDTR